MTQTQIVFDLVSGKEMSIKDIVNETNIKAPNIRRILGQGTKKGIFQRVAKGIYTITTGEETKAIINCADSLQEIKKLKNTNYKFDMVFLDIPYNTAAIKGGNRGVKYSLISASEFKEFLQDLKEVITDKTHVYHMFSNAPSGWKQMEQYNKAFNEVGFTIQGEGGWQKLFKNGKKCTNVRGVVSVREGLHLYSLGPIDTTDIIMDYESTRPRTASEKCSDMISQLILQSTSLGQRILDPFAGTGVVGEQALKLYRKVMLIEKSEDRVNNEILPRCLNIFN